MDYEGIIGDCLAVTPISVTVLQSEIHELVELLARIQLPDVTYSDDMLQMAQQALRLNRMKAESANEILYGWLNG